MNSRVFLLLVAAVLCTFFSGCAVTQDAIATAEVAAAGNDRYLVLATQALDGTVDPSMDLLPISSDDWQSTPESVRVLVGALLGGIGANRFAFRSIVFQLDAGPDPATLGLELVTVPEVADENDDLLAPENK